MNPKMIAIWLSIGGVAAPAPAQFVPISQKRYVFESTGEDFFIASASGFEPFDAAFTAVAQTSSITSGAIAGTGFAGPDPFFSINSATSFFDLEFTIDQPTYVIFSGSISTGLFGSGSANLSGPSGAIVDLVADEFAGISWNHAAELSAGQYTLEVFVSNSIGGDLSTFEFSFAVPSPSAAVLIAGAVFVRRRRRSA
jgi:hypothetical protein